MNRKIIFSGLSIFSALAIMGGAAFAQFAVSASASSNAFSSSVGTLDICTDDGTGISPATNTSTEPCSGSIESPIKSSDLVPGGPAENSFFWLFNTGTGPNDGLSGLTTIFNSPTGSGAGNGKLETALQVTITCPGMGSTTTSAFNNYENAGETFSPGTLAAGTYTRCQVSVSLPANNSTDANQILNFGATFGGNIGS